MSRLTLAELSRRYHAIFPNEEDNAEKFFNFCVGHLDAEPIAIAIAYDAVCCKMSNNGADEEMIRTWRKSVEPKYAKYRKHSF